MDKSTENLPTPQAAGVPKSLSLERIRADHEILCRVNIDEATVADYQRDIQAGVKLPPVDVFFDGVNENTGGNHWLADGFHRYLAHQRGGLARISCRVHRGTREDALWFAVAANQTHGLRRSTGDKEQAVRAALLHPKGLRMSDNQLAQHVGVSHPFVGKVRKALEQAGQLETVTSRTGADGRTRDTSKIGRKQKPEPELRVYTAEEIEHAKGEATARGFVPADLGPKCFDQDEEPDDPQHPPCANCGSRERDEYGDCASCHEPAESVDGNVAPSLRVVDVDEPAVVVDPSDWRAVAITKLGEALELLDGLGSSAERLIEDVLILLESNQ